MPRVTIDGLQALLEAPRFAWPRSANALIARGLESTDAAVLAIAITLGGRTMNDGVAGRLLATLEDGPTLELRLAAARALGYVMGKGAIFDFDVPCDLTAVSKRRFKAIRAGLRRLFHDPDSARPLRVAILETGARGGEAWAAGAARSAFRADDRAWQLAALRCMAHLPGFEAEVLDALADPELAAAGLQAATRRGLRSAGPHALRLARHPETPSDTQRAAILAVGALAPAGAAEALAGLADATDPDLAAAAGEALDVLMLDPPTP